MKERAIVRTDEYGSYEIWLIDVKEGPATVRVYGPVPSHKIHWLENHCHGSAEWCYYRQKTKPVKKPLAQVVLNLYEKQFDRKGQYRLVMRWRKP